MAANGHLVTTMDALEALYDQPFGPSIIKEIDHVNAPYRALIEAAPFFVRVQDERTLLVPDRRGNNRIDSLRNLIHDPRVALLFLIPGCGETLRIIGRAAISTDPALCESFMVQGKAPRIVLVVTVDRVYYQCPKAIVRSKLWDPSTWQDRKALPTSGKILSTITAGKVDAEAHDAAYPERIKATIY